VLPPAAADHVLLDEWTGKKLVAEAGVPIPTGRLSDAAGAPKAAVEIGFPVVVKLVDAALPHKTEARAVRLGLNSEADVAEAVAAIKLSVADHAPDLKPENFLVERMISGAIAEILVGIRRDEQFGLALVIGSGGRLVELVGDARTLLLPTSRDAVSEALSSLKVSALLEGFRGAPAGDREAVVEAVLLLTHFAQKHYGELDVLDVNPLMVLEDGVVALDVMLRMAG
jgi:succinyl-CoA synthetase beta subunit